MTRKITITDVAKYANVSVTAVSLALSGKGRISSITVNKINQAIEKLGYIRNKNAALLRSGHSGVIGVIVSDIRDHFYASMISGMNDMLVQQDYMLYLTQSGKQHHAIFKCVNSLIAHGVEGIILGCGGQIAVEIKQLTDKHHIPLIIATQSSNLTQMNIVRADNRQGAQLAIEYLIKNGHRQIAYFGGDSSSLTRAERLGGFSDILRRYGLKLRPEWVLDCEQCADLMHIERFLKHHPSVSAFLCHDATTTLLLFLSLTKLGRNISKNSISSYFEQQAEIFCFGHQQDLSLVNNTINYIDNQPYEIGHQAVNLLFAEDDEYQNRMITPKIVT